MFLLSLVIEDSNVYVEVGNDTDTEKFTLSPNRWKKVAAQFGIGAAESLTDHDPIPVDAALYDAIVDAAGVTRAIRDGARVLSGGAKSRRELIQKLCDRGAKRKYAEAAADFLEKRGYLDEAAEAETIARSLLRRNHYGPERIRAYLFSHGYPANAIREAIFHISPTDWRIGCMTLLRQKYTPWPTDANEQKKAYAALARLGYKPDQVRTARECLQEEM